MVGHTTSRVPCVVHELFMTDYCFPYNKVKVPRFLQFLFILKGFSDPTFKVYRLDI